MKSHGHVSLTTSALLLAMVASANSVSAEADRFEALANAPFEHNRPTAETAKTLRDELTRPCAVPRCVLSSFW
jgi:hypothetical protein